MIGPTTRRPSSVKNELLGPSLPNPELVAHMVHQHAIRSSRARLFQAAAGSSDAGQFGPHASGAIPKLTVRVRFPSLQPRIRMSAKAVLASPARAIGEHLAANDITMTFSGCTEPIRVVRHARRTISR